MLNSHVIAGLLLGAASILHDVSASYGWLPITRGGLIGSAVLDIAAIVLIGHGLFG